MDQNLIESRIRWLEHLADPDESSTDEMMIYAARMLGERPWIRQALKTVILQRINSPSTRTPWWHHQMRQKMRNVPDTHLVGWALVEDEEMAAVCARMERKTTRVLFLRWLRRISLALLLVGLLGWCLCHYFL